MPSMHTAPLAIHSAAHATRSPIAYFQDRTALGILHLSNGRLVNHVARGDFSAKKRQANQNPAIGIECGHRKTKECIGKQGQEWRDFPESAPVSVSSPAHRDEERKQGGEADQTRFSTHMEVQSVPV